MTSPTSTSKTCIVCGTDCSGKPRTKDSKGRYYCQPCYDKAKQKQALQQRRSVDAPPLLIGMSNDSPQPFSMLDKLISEVKPDSSMGCANCGAPAGVGTVICTQCGYNVQTGQKLSTRKVSAPRQRADAAKAVGVLANPTIVGLVLLAVIGVFLAMAWNDRTTLNAYLAIDALFGLVMGIVILISAFREGVGTGFLTLCVPCYVLYFVYGVCESAWIKMLFGVSLIMRVLGLIAGASSGMTVPEMRGF